MPKKNRGIWLSLKGQIKMVQNSSKLNIPVTDTHTKHTSSARCMLTARQTCHLPSLALPEPTLLSFGTASRGKAGPGSKYGLKNGVVFNPFSLVANVLPSTEMLSKSVLCLELGYFLFGGIKFQKRRCDEWRGRCEVWCTSIVSHVCMHFFCQCQWISLILPQNLDRPMPAIVLPPGLGFQKSIQQNSPKQSKDGWVHTSQGIHHVGP